MKKDEVSYQLGELSKGLENLTTHFTNHLSKHWRHDVFTSIQTLIIIGMFCYLKWGV